MKCHFCEKEFSDTVLPLHQNHCAKQLRKKVDEPNTTPQTDPETPVKPEEAITDPTADPEANQLSEYEQLKLKATELGLEYKHNISKKDLIKLIEDAQ